MWEYLSVGASGQIISDPREVERERRTDEHERVWDVVVAHVYDGRADPRADAALGAVEDRVHHARRLGRRLDAIEALAGVAQAVRDVF